MDYWKLQKAKNSKPGTRKLFYVYDDKMLLHQDFGFHPECPFRIESIYKYLKNNGYLDQVTKLKVVESKVGAKPPFGASYAAFETVHTRDEIRNVKRVSDKLTDKECEN